MTSTQQLPRTLEAAHAVIATLSEKLSQTLRENELLKQKIDKLCRRLFGKSSERVSPEQLALAFAQLPQDTATESDGALQYVDHAGPAFVVVNRTEYTAGLDGHHAHSHLAAGHALDFGAKVKRCQ